VYLLTEIVKFLGVVLSTIVAIAAVYFPDTKSAESGTLTRKGRLLVLAAVFGLVLSAGAQVTQIIDSQASAEATRQRNEQTAARLERIPVLIERSSFPLEPLELLFTIEYPMDQPKLKDYTRRVQSDIVAYLRNAREGRGATSDNLADEKMLFVISNARDWQPKDDPAESAAQAMLGDGTIFKFRDLSVNDDRSVRFLSGPPGLQGVVVMMKKQGDLVQKVELSADFQKRMFIKLVQCRNPIRSGSDVTAFSALDLVGRELTWEEGVTTNLTWNLVTFGLRFSYDYGFSQNYTQLPIGRQIEIHGNKAVKIVADNVGLASALGQK
jgi:hypothetical protein